MRGGPGRRDLAVIVIPVALYLLVAWAADLMHDAVEVDVGASIRSIPLYLVVIGGPVLVTDRVVRRRLPSIRNVVFGVLAGVSCWAGWIVGSQSDAQSGLSFVVLWFAAGIACVGAAVIRRSSAVEVPR